MESSKPKYGSLLFILLILIILVPTAVVVYFFANQEQEDEISNGITQPTPISKAEEAGREFSHNNCEGKGSIPITVSPMKEEDFAFIIPYGLTIGNHVTPIDHQYFSPTDFHSVRDTYEVFAMADGRIIEIQHRYIPSTSENTRAVDEYRIVIMHTCTFYTYYDLVTSLTPDIKREFDSKVKNNYAGGLSIDVKAGDLIGKIGGQTLDFAVWDMEKPLKGFVNPESYKAEPWKIYTADPYNYYSEELSELLTKFSASFFGFRDRCRLSDPI